eukprot:6182507-Alexandrium_andersonii.AAC.1
MSASLVGSEMCIRDRLTKTTEQLRQILEQISSEGSLPMPDPAAQHTTPGMSSSSSYSTSGEVKQELKQE